MRETSLSILIIGGYGTFGGRLVELLADEPRLTLFVAGQSLDKAASFCSSIAAQANLAPRFFDRSGDPPLQLTAIRPDIVVDATGPFQSYGDEPYALVKACLTAGCHYLDFADGSVFVKALMNMPKAGDSTFTSKSPIR